MNFKKSKKRFIIYFVIMKSKIFQKLIIFIFLITFLKEKLDAKVLIIGVYDNPPKVYLKNHKPQGIFIDIIEYIAKKEKWEIKYKTGSWEECLNMLENEQIDIMLDVAYSGEREKKFDFNRISIISSWIQLFVSEECYKSFNEVENKKLAVIKASIQEEFFGKLSENNKLNLELIKVSSYEEAINAVKLKRADAAVLSRFYAFRVANHKLKPTPFIYAFTTLHFASKKDKNREILLTIDKYMSEALNKPDSFYYKTLEKYLQRATPYFVPSYIIWIIISLIFAILFFVIITFILIRILKIKTIEITKSNSMLKKNIKRLLDNESRLKLTIKDKEKLYQELNHRVKNNMNIICSLIALKSSNLSNVEIKDFARDIENKIFSMALVHQLLYKSENLSFIDIKEYIELFVERVKYFYSDSNKNVTFKNEVESIKIPIDIAIPLGIVINELISNCYKHAFPENYNGEINIKIFGKNKEKISITFSDNGVGKQKDIEEKRSLGLNIVFEIVEKQLHGKIRYHVKNGVTYFIEMPVNLYDKRI